MPTTAKNMLHPGNISHPVQLVGLPAHLDGHTTYDVDYVLTVQVYALRPGRSAAEQLHDIGDQLRADGWTSRRSGHIPHVGQYGLQFGYEGDWAQWVKV